MYYTQYLVRTHCYDRVGTRVRRIRVQIRSHRFEWRTVPKLVEAGRTPRSRLSRSSPDAMSSQYRVSPPAELVSDLCQSRASRHSPFLSAGYFVFSRHFSVRRTLKYETVVSRDFLVFVASARVRIPFSWSREHTPGTSTYKLDTYSTHTVIQCHSGVTSGENKN